ncbi:unnamed protein product [Urochloa decumbens]|uniref:F-box domain-containing protein n=1 Tax=Urochloa decumbens TaxID=240449 RepID=A0ABC9AUE3_9POAL
MPPKKKGGKGKRAAAPGAARAASLDVLPDEVLGHVLSFLPAQEAVRTCVLARRWRHLWRNASGLHISCDGEEEGASMKELREFVDHLFLIRGGSPLDTCQLSLLHLDDNYADNRRIHLWIRHVLMCRVRELSLNISWNGDPARCPALEVLEIKDCDIINLDRISSQSLKSLSISDYCDFSENDRIHVCAPNLVSLWLEVAYGKAPILESMPSLLEAVVKIYGNDTDCCHHYDFGDSEDEDCPCSGVHGDTDCVLLQGLSEAQSLVLIADFRMFIFRMDLKCCPIFSNLKTLLLVDFWCVPTDFSALASILEHSPVLEKLTLKLFCKEPKSKVQMKGSPDQIERSNAISQHLKVVEVKYHIGNMLAMAAAAAAQSHTHTYVAGWRKKKH